MLQETRESQHSPSVPGVFSLVDHCTPAFPCPHQCWLLSLLLALLCSAQLPPAPSCKGCRALFRPPADFPKAPGAHRGLHLPGCCRRRRAPSPEGPPDQPRVPAACISIAVRAGLWEFLLHFFPLPSLSLSLLLAYFCLLQGLGSFPETAFPKEATLRWTAGGKVFASPRHRSSHAPLCCCCSELEPLFGAGRGTQHPRGKNSPLAAPLLPEGRAANWVSWDLLRSPCARLGPFFA